MGPWEVGTAAHMGTFGLSYRIDSVLIQNLLASGSLSLISSLILAVLAKGTASAFGLSPAMSLADFIVISVLGGVLSSIALAAVTVVLSVGSGNAFSGLVSASTTAGLLLSASSAFDGAFWSLARTSRPSPYPRAVFFASRPQDAGFVYTFLMPNGIPTRIFWGIYKGGGWYPAVKSQLSQILWMK